MQRSFMLPFRCFFMAIFWSLTDGKYLWKFFKILFLCFHMIYNIIQVLNDILLSNDWFFFLDELFFELQTWHQRQCHGHWSEGQCLYGWILTAHQFWRPRCDILKPSWVMWDMCMYAFPSSPRLPHLFLFRDLFC